MALGGGVVSFRRHVCMLLCGVKIFLWQRATPVIEGWFIGRMSQLTISGVSIGPDFCVILITNV